MSVFISIGSSPNGADVLIDVEELLASRLLVQGNSGSGKSHLLRRLLEQSAGLVQQIVIDPEGDFVTLAEPYRHIVIDGSAYGGAEIGRLAARVRERRASVVLALDGLEVDAQMRCAAQFLSALFDAPRDQWYPALVVVDEAQLFAPAIAGEVSDEARRLSLAAMTNLMCRGRKRGLAGVIATQRLAKLAKNVAAEASNFLMGRTFLDIDMARAADLLGMERRQAEEIRDLERGHFIALGPALSRRPLPVRIGPVRTASSAATHGLLPLPPGQEDEAETILAADWRGEDMSAPMVEPAAVAAEVLIDRIEKQSSADEAVAERPDPGQADAPDLAGAISEILAEMAQDDGSTFQPAASLYQDFTVRCRMRRVDGRALDLAAFRRQFAAAVAGIDDPTDQTWSPVMHMARQMSDDLVAPFLLIARAARENEQCPTDDELARVYGTRSSGRIRRLLDHLERSGLIVVRTDFGGRRSMSIPQLGLTTAPAAA